MNSKAQLSQVFVYILGLVIFSLMLIYGYRVVSNFTSKADEISSLQLEKELENAIKKTSSDFGTVLRKEIIIPGTASRVCFVDITKSSQAPLKGLCIDSEGDYNAAACDSWETGSRLNMFLIQDTEEIEPLFIGDIEIPDPYYDCINVSRGSIVLRLEGTGGKTKLERWG